MLETLENWSQQDICMLKEREGFILRHGLAWLWRLASPAAAGQTEEEGRDTGESVWWFEPRGDRCSEFPLPWG